MTDHEPTLPASRAAAPKRHLDPATPEVVEAEGHAAVPNQPDPAEAEAEGEAEVTGQLHPELAQRYAASRRQDMLAEAEQDRRRNEAERQGQGLRDRLRRRGEAG